MPQNFVIVRNTNYKILTQRIIWRIQWVVANDVGRQDHRTTGRRTARSWTAGRIVRWESDGHRTNQGRSNGNVATCNAATAMALLLLLRSAIIARRCCSCYAALLLRGAATAATWHSCCVALLQLLRGTFAARHCCCAALLRSTLDAQHSCYAALLQLLRDTAICGHCCYAALLLRGATANVAAALLMWRHWCCGAVAIAMALRLCFFFKF
jgi:hypothetical protein